MEKKAIVMISLILLSCCLYVPDVATETATASTPNILIVADAGIGHSSSVPTNSPDQEPKDDMISVWIEAALASPYKDNIYWYTPTLNPKYVTVENLVYRNNHQGFTEIYGTATFNPFGMGYGPDATIMNNFDLVIWFTGDSMFGAFGQNYEYNMVTLRQQDQNNIKSYLESGGAVWLSGAGIMLDMKLITLSDQERSAVITYWDYDQTARTYLDSGTFSTGHFIYDYFAVQGFFSVAQFPSNTGSQFGEDGNFYADRYTSSANMISGFISPFVGQGTQQFPSLAMYLDYDIEDDNIYDGIFNSPFEGSNHMLFVENPSKATYGGTILLNSQQMTIWGQQMPAQSINFGHVATGNGFATAITALPFCRLSNASGERQNFFNELVFLLLSVSGGSNGGTTPPPPGGSGNPELSISPPAIQFLPDPYPEAGDGRSIRATVSNTGTGRADNVEVKFYFGDPRQGGTLIGTAYITTIAPGDTGSCVVSTGVMTAGRKDIYVVVTPAPGETDVSNNMASTFIIVGSSGSSEIPEVYISSIQISSEPYVINTPIFLNVTAGAINTTANDVSIRVWNGIPGSVGSSIVSTVSAGNIQVGESNQKTTQISFQLASHGIKEVYVEATVSGGVGNTKKIMFMVRESLEPSNVDLYVNDILISPVAPVPGDEVTLSFRIGVKNESAMTVNVAVYNGHPESEFSSPVGANYYQSIEKDQVTAYHTVSLGYLSSGVYNYYVKIFPDDYETVIENNIMGINFVIGTPVLPDVSIDAINIIGDPVPGTQVIIEAVVSCSGADATSIPVQISIRAPGGSVYHNIYNTSISYLGPQSAPHKIRTTWLVPFTAGTYDIRADASRFMGDANQANNIINRTVEVLPLSGIDTYITQVSFSPVNPNVGDVVRVSVSIGSTETFTTAKLRLYNSDSSGVKSNLIQEKTVLYSEINSDIIFDWTTTAPAGTRKLYISLVPQDNEINPLNNERNITFNINPENAAKADLVVSSVDVRRSDGINYIPLKSNESAIIGEMLRIVVNVKNDGSQDTTNVLVRLEVSIPGDIREYELTITELAAGENRNAIFTVPMNLASVPKTYTIVAIADPFNMISESSIDNNYMRKYLNVANNRSAFPDLYVVPSGFSIVGIDAAKTGREVSVRFTVNNIGNREAVGSRAKVYVQSFGTLPELIEEISLEQLILPGDSRAYTVPWMAVSGIHAFRVEIILANDMDIENNVMTSNIYYVNVNPEELLKKNELPGFQYEIIIAALAVSLIISTNKFRKKKY